MKSLRGKHCEITVENRPPYCNRGRFLAKVFPDNHNMLDCPISSADFWPRYYFFWENLDQEVKAWLKAHGQFVEENDWEEEEEQ